MSDATSNPIVAIDRNAPREPLLWGPQLPVVSVSLGDCVFRFVSADPAIAFTLSNRFELFRVTEDQPADCTVGWSTGPTEAWGGRPIQQTSLWETRRRRDGGEQTLFFLGDRRVPYLDLTFEPGYQSARIVQSAGTVGAGVGPDLHPLSEFLVSRVLARRDRAEVHASAAVANDRAYVFVGHSGAGKTTISRIAELAGAIVLSDDRVIVGMRDGAPRAWGTPWHGSGAYTSARSGELAGIFLLEKGEKDAVEPLSYAAAIKELFVRLIQVRVESDEVLRSHAVLEEVLATVPAFRLSFRPTVAAFFLAQRAADRTSR